jgi:hypothetical protein
MMAAGHMYRRASRQGISAFIPMTVAPAAVLYKSAFRVNTAYMARSRVFAAEPSPPWYGALISALNFAGAGWLLAYTLLRVRPIESLGAWNYVIVAAVIPAQAVLMLCWRGHPYRREPGAGRPGRTPPAAVSPAGPPSD